MAKTSRSVGPRRSVTKGIWIGAILLLVFAVVLAFAMVPRKVSLTDQVARESRRKVGNIYLSSNKNPDTWWLETARPGNPPNLAELLAEEKQSLLVLLDKYKSASPMAGEVHARFRELFVTVAKDGISFRVTRVDDGPPKGTEVCFIPRDQFTGREPSTLYWDGRWKAVKMAALEWPEPLKAGVLFHELGHGLFDGRPAYRTPPASAPRGSMLMVSAQEEIIMHELELDVMDNACDGAYRVALRKIVRSHNAADWRSLMGLITVEDLRTLDRVLGSEKYGESVAKVVSAQNFLALGLCQIEVDQAPSEEKAALYRWLVESVTRSSVK